MKLGIVTAYPPSKVTLNEYAYHLVKHFRQLEEVSEIILYTDIEDGVADISFTEMGCPIRVVSCWKFNSYANIATVTKALIRTKPDMVLFNLQFMKFGSSKVPAALGLFLPWISKRLNIPTIVLLHNIMETVDLGEVGFAKNRLASRIYNGIGTFLTKIVLKANKVAVTIQKYVGELESKYLVNNVILIPHGTFEIPEIPTYDKVNEVTRIMTFGKFGTYKKVEALIEAMMIIRERTGESVELVIAGTDNPNCKGYLEAVKKQYEHVPDVHFTGYVEEEEVPRLFVESDIVVFPYTATTGSSGVLHQAGSYGKAAVMPNLGDLASLVQDEGYRGEFFEPSNTQSMADAIEKLILNDTYRKELAKANYKAASSWPMIRVASKYIEEFESLGPSKEGSFIKSILTYFL
ncbi:glycosyltransferase [Aureisphaera galaxeae]|uniref:glycosyltransferase n=1 Tax=Aureisphaera galaxeae TaxID=1538023 RepID=UPI002350608F|nr:glycosyltransferase [Aureisphaera galaxeae]MDC8005687.1 glycosyltransferase [Aureisphaera galaxeae]